MMRRRKRGRGRTRRDVGRRRESRRQEEDGQGALARTCGPVDSVVGRCIAKRLGMASRRGSCMGWTLTGVVARR